MGEKHIIFYPVPVEKIAAGELSLDPDKIPIAGTTFSTPCSFDYYLTNQRDIGGRDIKRTEGSFAISLHSFFYAFYVKIAFASGRHSSIKFILMRSGNFLRCTKRCWKSRIDDTSKCSHTATIKNRNL